MQPTNGKGKYFNLYYTHIELRKVVVLDVRPAGFQHGERDPGPSVAVLVAERRAELKAELQPTEQP